MELGKKRGMDVEYKTMLAEEMYDFEECFLTGTAAEIIPVVEIGGRTIGSGNPGETMLALLENFRALTKTDGVKY